ncbi:MAG: hypothetical protein FJ271_33175 [Planctomycetes bacterium]|nr:hypothetical protein [Planctomycetota bacterium]
MESRRALLLGLATGAAAIPLAGKLVHASSRPATGDVWAISSSLTTHWFCNHMLVWSEAIPVEYRAYFCVGPYPGLLERAVPAASERKLAEYMALLSCKSFLPAALVATDLADEIEHCEASADLVAAERAAFNVYREAKYSTTDTPVPGGMKCAEGCAHHTLGSLQAAASEEDSHLPHAGRAAASVLSTLRERYVAADFETDWIGHMALDALKGMLRLEMKLRNFPDDFGKNGGR